MSLPIFLGRSMTKLAKSIEKNEGGSDIGDYLESYNCYTMFLIDVGEKEND